MIRDLTSGSVTKNLLVFAFPFMLSNLLQTLYNLVDMIIVGQFVGAVGLSAVSIGGEALHLTTFIGTGFATSGQIMISQYVGRGDKDAVKRTIGTMFTGILGGSFLIMAAFLIFAEPLLHLLNTPAEAFSQALDYSVVCYIGTFFIFGYNTVSAILRGMGDSTRPLIFVAIAAVTNLVLDLLFVAVFNMESLGAALATVIGQAVSFLCSIAYLYRRRESFGFDFKLRSFKPDLECGRLLLKLGIPMALQYCAINISQMFVNAYINDYGVVASAVSGVGHKIGSIASIVTTSLSAAGGAMAGQNFGAGKQERISRMMGVIAIIGIAFCALLSAVMAVAPETVFGLFNNDPEVLAMSHDYVIVAVLTFFGFAVRAPFIALINGQGFASFALVMGLVDGVVARIGLALLMGIVFDMGIMGFWLGSAIAGFSPMLIGGVYYFSGLWKKYKLLIGD